MRRELDGLFRRVLVIYCGDHAVATCERCTKSFKLDQMGVDVFSRDRSPFCPSCRHDLTDAIRLHILGCSAIAAALEERIHRAEELVKQSDRLRTESGRLAAESNDFIQRVLRRRGPGQATP